MQKSDLKNKQKQKQSPTKIKLTAKHAYFDFY